MPSWLRGYGLIILGAVLLLTGCAGPPPPPGPVPRVVLPPPPAYRSSQEQVLEQAISRFHGAPYRAGGADPSGVDCSGLIQAAFHQAGVNLPRTVAKQYNQGQPVGRQDLRFGDVIFFNRFCQTKARNYFMAGMLTPGHVEEACHNGIYLGQGRFIHASPRGVYVGRLDAEVWSASFLGARRYLPNGPPAR